MSTTTTSSSDNDALHDDLDIALWYACMRGHVGIMRMLLLETWADPLPDPYLSASMDMAKEKGQQECQGEIEVSE